MTVGMYNPNILYLLLSNLVTQKYLQYQIDIITAQTFRHVCGTFRYKNVKINTSSCQAFVNWVTLVQT